jgi:hypothetical protein
VIGQVTTTKWAFESLVTISGMGECVSDEACKQAKCSGPSVLYECDFPGVRSDLALTDPQMAIAEAESTISTIDKNWGQTFDVNVAAHWAVLVTITAVWLGLAVGALKWKDRR